MKIWKIAVPLVIIVAAIYTVPRIGKSTVVEQDGNQLSIAIGKHRLTATAVSDQITDSFLVVGGWRGDDMYFTTLVSPYRVLCTSVTQCLCPCRPCPREQFKASIGNPASSSQTGSSSP